MQLAQTGATVTGCNADTHARIAGGFDGRVLRFASGSGAAAMTFGAGRAFYGAWTGDAPPMTMTGGARTSEQPGTCTGDAKLDPIAAELAATGRARLFDVGFDAQTNKLRDDAKPALDRLVAILQAQPALAIRIEAHVDPGRRPMSRRIAFAPRCAPCRFASTWSRTASTRSGSR